VADVIVDAAVVRTAVVDAPIAADVQVLDSSAAALAAPGMIAAPVAIPVRLAVRNSYRKC
jgi:hypothetical protein